MPISLWEKLGFKSGVNKARKVIKASYDAARNSDRLDTLYEQATSKSADAEGSPTVRTIIRNRARLEYRNNGYCRGIVDTKANDIVGRSPTLEMQTDNEEINQATEDEFQTWADEINLGRKIRQAKTEKIVSGEAFIVLITNKKLRNKNKLDLLIVEADRVTTPTKKVMINTKNYQDGIQYDDNGIPVSYDILKIHPGDDTINFGSPLDFDTIPADRVIHWYKQNRPEQKRGISEIASGITIYSQLRRYTLATLTAAETAASFSWLLTTTDKEAETVAIDPMDEIELNMGSGLTAPAGWGVSQMKAEQPSTQYPDFKRELLSEAARGLNMPLNVALMNSRGFNFASGRLDHLNYFRDNQVQRNDLSKDVLSRIFGKWNEENRLIRRGRILSITNGKIIPRHTWHYDGTQHQDPAKEASAQEKRLKNLTSNLAIEYAALGLDWKKAVKQIAREQKELDALGLTREQAAPPPPPVDDDDQDEDQEDDDEIQSEENAA